MSSADQIHRFIFDETDIRGEIVTLDECIKQQQQTLALPTTVQNVLGEFIAAAVLMSSTLKFEGVFTLQARGSGPVPLIMAEVRNNKEVRGIAKCHQECHEDDALFTGDTNQNLTTFLPTLVGKDSVLSITLDPDKGERYQGIVPLDSPTLAECIEDYFRQSEQLPTKIWLSCKKGRAAGLFLQVMPQQLADTDTNTEAWNNRIQLANTITEDELLSLDHEPLLTRLFHEEGVRLFEPQVLRFQCSCSKTRCSQALIQIGQKEMNSIIQEEKIVKVDCQFCGYQYQYHQGDIDALFLPPLTH